jgi:tetratricopeptide (TPR) repeat protein
MENSRLKLLAATLILSFLLGLPTVAMAQKKTDPEDTRKTKETVAMSQAVYEKLTEIQEMVEAKDYASAQRLIEEAKEKKLTDYERAQVYNLSAYSYYLQERYKEAIVAYNQVLAQPGLPEALMMSTLKTKAQLQFTTEDYEAALATIRQLIASITEPSADVFMLEGQALQGQIPKENWLLLLRVIYFEMKDYDNMIEVVRELIAYYPKDTYILTLAGIYSELGDTKKQLVLTEVLYEKGYLHGSGHATNLANLYLLHGLPYKAAQTLEREIEANVVEANERNLRLLSQAWYQAREDRKAIAPLKAAAEMSDSGELYIRLAQSYINLEEWKAAGVAVQKGLNLGGLKRDDQANIMLGMALFNQKRLQQARRAFEKAQRDKRSARAAGQWINYVDSEVKRQELMGQDIPEYQPKERDELLDALPQN